MKFKTKFVALATLAAMLASSTPNLAADEYDAGYAYGESTETSNLTPAIALGAIAAVAIIAVVVTDPFGHHHHHHGHN